MNKHTPIRETMLPYGRQTIDQSDIDCVVDVLKNSNYLTTGPKVKEFEAALCNYTGMKHAIVVSNGTTALHCATYAADIKPGDEVIVTTLSFVASANAILYQGGTPIFADIEPDTMNIDVDKIEPLITDKTKAIIAVDFAGQLCNYRKLRKLADKYNLIIIEDAAHSIGVTRSNYVDLITYSFHPVKTITTGEGGAIMTNNEYFANKMRIFRNHGIDADYKNRYLHYYSMTELSNNYRLKDIQFELGIKQLKK